MNALDELKLKKKRTHLEQLCIVSEFMTVAKSNREQAATELLELEAIKEAAWKLIEHPDSEAKKRELARLLGVEL